MLPQYKTKTLENGLQIVCIPMNKNSNVISTNVFYKVGSGDEIMGKSGIAHMLEHLNFKSTKNLKAGEFDEIVKSFGGINNASTSFDYTHYFIKSSKKNLDKSLKLYAELMSNLNLKKNEFLPERDVVFEERLWRTDNSPMGYLYFRLFNETFTYHSYHWTPIGFSEDIKNWTLKDIKKFHKNFYRPSNAIIVVSGDIDENEVFETTAKYFSNIKNPKNKIPKNHQIEMSQVGKKEFEIIKQSEVELLAIAYKIPAFNHEDIVALNALGELLADGNSSIFAKKLIHEKEYSQEINAYAFENKHPSLFIITCICNIDIKASLVKKEILNILKDIKKGNFDEQSLQKVKTNTKASFIKNLQTCGAVASIYGGFFARGSINPLFEYQKSLENLTKEDIIRVCQKYFIDENQTIAILKKESNEN